MAVVLVAGAFVAGAFLTGGVVAVVLAAGAFFAAVFFGVVFLATGFVEVEADEVAFFVVDLVVAFFAAGLASSRTPLACDG